MSLAACQGKLCLICTKDPGKSAQKTLKDLLDSICNVITDDDCINWDLTVVLPLSKTKVEVPVTHGALDLSTLCQSKPYFSQLPVTMQQRQDRQFPLSELLQCWYPNSLFELCKNISSMLEIIIQKKAGDLLQHNILACQHIEIPFQKKRCQRLDVGLRSSLAKMKEFEFAHFKLRLLSKGQSQTIHAPRHDGIAKRENMKQIQSYIRHMHVTFNALPDSEKNVWLAADAGTVGLESNLCSAAVLGHNGPSCWFVPQASIP